MLTSLIPLTEHTAAARSGAIAVTAHDGTLTSGELSERADAVARRLHDVGVRRGDFVGLCLGRSAALVVGALGIVRAGAAFVAIDPAYPDERVRWMLEDADAAAVVTDPALDARLGASSGRRRVVLAAAGALPAEAV
ncbi:MAG: hypothetical protein QOI80_1159, partial [Solirubrobacteraceae bacterium]|nr:hypothetical protein [Solirubrobacteraceae bacterium]